MADALVDEYDIIDLLDRLVGYSVELLAADAAGIVLADARGELRAVAASSEDAQLSAVDRTLLTSVQVIARHGALQVLTSPEAWAEHADDRRDQS